MFFVHPMRQNSVDGGDDIFHNKISHFWKNYCSEHFIAYLFETGVTRIRSETVYGDKRCLNVYK